MRAAIEPPLFICFLCHANKSVTFLKHVQCRMRLISFECMRLCGVYRILIIIWFDLVSNHKPIGHDSQKCIFEKNIGAAHKKYQHRTPLRRDLIEVRFLMIF